MLKYFINYSKESFLKTLAISAVCLFSYFVAWLVVIFTGDADFALRLPFISPWIHSDLSHFLINIIPLFVLMLSEKNRFKISCLLIIPILIEVAFLPLIFFGTATVIGLSKFIFFLFARFMLTRENNKVIHQSVFVFIFTLELLQIGSGDLISHEGHIFGSILGIISIYAEKKGLLKRC